MPSTAPGFGCGPEAGRALASSSRAHRVGRSTTTAHATTKSCRPLNREGSIHTLDDAEGSKCRLVSAAGDDCGPGIPKSVHLSVVAAGEALTDEVLAGVIQSLTG